MNHHFPDVHMPHTTAEDLNVRQRDNALIHLAKELGESFFAVAISRKGLPALVDEAQNQLAQLSGTRDENGLIVTGKLDLSKLGLNPAEVVARKEELKALSSTPKPISPHIRDEVSPHQAIVGAGMNPDQYKRAPITPDWRETGDQSAGRGK